MSRNVRWKTWCTAVALALGGCAAEVEPELVGVHAEQLTLKPGAVTPTTPTTGSGYLGTLATVGITSPKHGEVMYGGEPWYNATAGANGSITVEGGASNLPAALVNGANLQVRLNNIYGATILSTRVTPANGGEITFRGIIPAVVDPSWVQRDINVAIVNGANNRVLGRSTNVIYDLRRENVASPYAEPDPFDGMAVHFMPGGIGDTVFDDWTTSLETPHLGTLPLGGVNAFNDALQDAVRGETVPAQDVDICFPLDEADSAFRSLPQYIEVYAQAAGLLSVYLAWQNGGEEACASAAASLGAANPIIGALGAFVCAQLMDRWCVTSVPKDSDFEVCFTRLEGDPENLWIDSVSDVQLTWGASNVGMAVNAQLALSGIEGRLDGALRGASIRWIDKGNNCEGQPLASVPDSEFDTNKDAAEAVSCPDLELTAELATTTALTGASFLVQSSGLDEQYVDVTQIVDPVLSFKDVDIFTRKGMCEDIDLWSASDALVESFESTAERALNATWNAGEPQAEALELLLDRLELGLIDHPSYDLFADISMMRSDSRGADVGYETRIQSTVPLVDTDRTTYHHPAHPAPFSPDGTDPDEVDIDFEMAFTVNTGFLNQIISTQSKTDLLWFSETLDNTALTGMHSAFAELGARTVSITIRPTLDPLAWMNPDPPLTDFADLAFGVGGMDVTISEPEHIDPATGKPVPGMVWLSARYSLREPIFDLSIKEGSNVLETSPTLSISYLTIMSHRFTSCPMVTSGAGNACESGLASAVASYVRDLIEPRMISMLSRIPVPNVWNADGDTSAPVELDLVGQYQMNQNVTFMVDIVDN